MPEYTAKLFGYELDARRFSEALAEDIQLQIKEAARQFVKIASLSVPVHTGFAAGTFNNILEAIGDARLGARFTGDQKRTLKGFQKIKASAEHIPISARKHGTLFHFLKPSTIESLRKAGGLGIPLEYYRGGGGGKVLKTPQSGRQFATPPGDIFKRDGFVFTFNFDVDITYFNINDQNTNPHTPSAPWKSFFRGRAFFLLYLQRFALKKLPAINSFLVEEEYDFSGSGVRRSTKLLDRGTVIKVKG